MKINGIKFDLEMTKLFNEVKVLLGDRELRINFVDELLDEETLQIGGGAYAKKCSDGNWEILVCKDDSCLDYTLSHELLHVFLDEKGFPNIFHTNKDICCELSANIGTLISNVVLHKIIITEQAIRGFNVVDAPRKKLQDVVTTWQILPKLSDQTLGYVLAVVSFFIEGAGVLSDYEDDIKNKNPFLYQPAKLLYDSLCEKPYTTPFETRRALVKTFKKMDELLISYDSKPLKLHEKLIVKYIPSKRQLSLKVSNVFNAYTNVNDDLLITAQSDEQLCFLYENGSGGSLKDELKDMTVEAFLTWAYKDFTVRE